MTDKNTAKSFSDKWNNNPSLAFEETLNPQSEIFQWIINRNGFSSETELSSFLNDKKRILDAGCGNGRVTALLRKYSNNTTEVVGIDLVASAVAEANLAKEDNCKFYQKNLMEPITGIGLFDFIYCQEVLHHTPDPKKSFNNLVDILSKNGTIAIYVYKKKAPIREFTDDYVRQQIAGLSYDDAMKACIQITELGKTLSDLKISIEVPDVDILEIKKGSYDLQRFLYHFFMKCFWNNNFSLHDNAVINYDWYHPQDCSRHTMKEILGWFTERGLIVNHQFEDFYGITVRGTLG